MDAGHLAASVCLAAEAFGLRYFMDYPANEDEVERELGISRLEEGYLVSMALGEADVSSLPDLNAESQQ